MARALGLPGCDYRDHPCNQYEPNKRMLVQECKRRIKSMSISAKRVGQPSTCWLVGDLANWLRQHPIENDEEADEVKSQVGAWAAKLQELFPKPPSEPACPHGGRISQCSLNQPAEGSNPATNALHAEDNSKEHSATPPTRWIH